MSYKVDIPKLSEDNYSLWKTTMRNELRAMDTEVFIIKDVKPSAIDSQDARKYWSAVSIITSSVSKELAHLVITESDDPDEGYPFLLWKRIEQHFNPMNSAAKHRLKVDFFKMELEDGEEVNRFISRINEAAIRVNMVLTALKRKEGYIGDNDNLSVLLAGIEKEFPVDFALLSKDSAMTFDLARVYVTEHCKKRHDDSE